MKMTGKPFHPVRQRGVSLIIVLLIVVLLSLLALYGAGVLVLDTRSSANDFRAREALAAAESGTEQGLSLLNANRKGIMPGGLDVNNDGAVDNAWATCGSQAWCLPVRSGDRANWQFINLTALASQPTGGSSFSLYLLTPVPDADPDKANGSLLVYNVVAVGESADETSTATLKQAGYFYPLLLANVDTPLAAATNVTLSGNYSIITSPNGGGPGVPVTAWSDGAITPGGSFTSCQIGDFDGSACPTSDALSKNGLTGPDLVGNDDNFPDDLFEFMFGVPEDDYQAIKDQAEVVADCSGLGPTSSGLIWVTGACNPPGTIGSAVNPVLLVVQGNVTFNAGDDLYGLLFMFDPTGSTPTLTANGNAHLHGALFAHDDVNLSLNGGFVLEYDKDVLDNLNNSPSGRGLARIPGAWSDVQ